MTWHEGTLWGFDLETTGTDPHRDRIVTASLVKVRRREVVSSTSWLVNPGIEIPQEATNIHGISTYKAITDGVEPLTALTLIDQVLRHNADPLVVFNAAFDLTMLDAEMVRHGLEPIREYRPVIDPHVIDKQADKYRPGKRTLSVTCPVYGVKLKAAHNSDADALAAVHLAIRLAERYPELQDEPAMLHNWQAKWRGQQCASLQKHFRKQGDKKAVVNPEWPVMTSAA